MPQECPGSRLSEVVIQGLHKSFDGKTVLAGVDLCINRGDMVAIVGGSGCGKTVLLKHITGHFRADSGTVLVADHEAQPGPDGEAPLVEVGHAPEAELESVRRHWAIVFQRNALLSGTVFQNLALLLRETQQLTDDEVLPLARKALHDAGLDADAIMHRDRADLSGGMAKRVAIARALVVDPVLVMYDEPSAGLDPEMCAHIHELIRKTHAAQPAYAAERPGILRTSIVVTHDTELLRRLQPRIVMLHSGRVRFDGTFDAFMASDDEHIRPYLEQMSHLHHSRVPSTGS